MLKLKNLSFKNKWTLPAILAGIIFVSCGNPGEKDVGPPRPEYTEDDPGRWADIADDHLPDIKIQGGFFSPKISISLESKKWSRDHYIEKIGLFRIKDKRDLAVQEFPRGTFVYTAEFPYEYNDDEVKVFVKCNLHDLWTVEHLDRFHE